MTPSTPPTPADACAAALAAPQRAAAVQAKFVKLQLRLTEHVAELMTSPGKSQEAAQFLESAWAQVASDYRKRLEADGAPAPPIQVLCAIKLLGDYFGTAGDLRRAIAQLRSQRDQLARGEPLTA